MAYFPSGICSSFQSLQKCTFFFICDMAFSLSISQSRFVLCKSCSQPLISVCKFLTDQNRPFQFELASQIYLGLILQILAIYIILLRSTVMTFLLSALKAEIFIKILMEELLHKINLLSLQQYEYYQGQILIQDNLVVSSI